MSLPSSRGFGSLDGPASSGGNSSTSDITSASALCSSLQFQTWATIVGLNINVNTSIPSHQAFQPLEDLKNLSNQFPAWLGNEVLGENLWGSRVLGSAIRLSVASGSFRERRTHSPQFQYVASTCSGIAKEICTGLARKPECLHDDVELHLAALQVILNACRHMQLLAHDPKPTETDRRYLVDAMLIYICESDISDANELVKYRGEKDLKVPQVQCGKYNVEKTRADGVMYLDVPDFAPYQHSELNAPATAFLQSGYGDNLYVVHCAVEFEREGDGSNQGMMAMVSGLYQRAVLQMPEQFVFGVLHSKRVLFQIVAGIWQGDKIRLYEIGSYNLADPTEALRFYLVLRGIHRLGRSYDQELQSSAQGLSTRVRENPPSREWRPPRMGIIGEDLNEDQQPPHQGGTNTQQETLGQSRAHHKVQSYLETTSSLSGFFPVDRPPTPPIELPSAETSPSLEPGLDDGSDSSSDESEPPRDLPSYAPIPQDHKAHLSDPLRLGGVQCEGV